MIIKPPKPPVPTPPQLVPGKLIFPTDAPDVSVREAVTSMAVMDPVVWMMRHRKIRGNRMVFDVRQLLTADALETARRTAAMTKNEYAIYVKTLYLRHRPFMVEPAADQHPHKVYKKGRQIGISELSLSEVLWFLATHPQRKCVYTFPREKQLEQFSNSRIKPAFEETPAMRKLLDSSMRGVFMKKICDSYLILRSAWESNLGEGVDADMVVFDERDRMGSGIEVAFQESMKSSAYMLMREVSTPTLPQKGVDASYQRSDQRTWLVRCERCNLWQPIEYPSNFLQLKEHSANGDIPDDSWRYACRKERCRGALDRMRGRWVAKRPDVKDVRGYHMPQAIAAWIDCTRLMRDKKRYRFLQLWLNYVMAEVADSDSMLLNEHDFAMADADYDPVLARTEDWAVITAGVDWGAINWITVVGINAHNGKAYVLNRIAVEDTREPLESARLVGDRLDAYEPDIIVADAGYGKDRCAHLFKRFGPGRFFACWYLQTEKGGSYKPSWTSDDVARVSVSRTALLKTTCQVIKDRELGLPNREHRAAQEIEAHFLALRLLHEEDEDTGDVVETIAHTDDDHLAHATAYALMALDRAVKGSSFQFGFLNAIG